jgi:ubiquitin-protein ligase
MKIYSGLDHDSRQLLVKLVGVFADSQAYTDQVFSGHITFDPVYPFWDRRYPVQI